jgi:hypothetical protein
MEIGIFGNLQEALNTVFQKKIDIGLVRHTIQLTQNPIQTVNIVISPEYSALITEVYPSANTRNDHETDLLILTVRNMSLEAIHADLAIHQKNLLSLQISAKAWLCFSGLLLMISPLIMVFENAGIFLLILAMAMNGLSVLFLNRLHI